MPDPNRIESIEEPWIEGDHLRPDDYLGPILKLCQDRRGIQKNLTYVGGRAQLTRAALERSGVRFLRPAEEHVEGYASFDYHRSATARAIWSR